MGSNPTPRTKTQPTGLVEFEEFLRTRLTARNTNLAEATIQTRLRAIKMLQKRVNLWDSDEVQRYIDSAPWSNGRREQVSLAYWDWCNSKGFKFKRKTYYREQKIPYIPTEKELDQLIGGFHNSPYAPFLQLLKETGFRPVEAKSLTPSDFDLQRKWVILNSPAKNSRPRQARISEKLVNMLTPVIAKTKPNELIWKTKLNHLTETIRCHKIKVADRLCNPNLKKITLKTFRHWKGSITYHQTKDILYPQQVLSEMSRFSYRY